jgi:hypothetical protein
MMVLLKTSDSASTSQDFYICRDGDGVIGFDGLGAIDFDHSDLKKVIREGSSALANPYAVRLMDKPGRREIVMRRAVRLFDLYYDYRFNILLVAPDTQRDFENCINQSVDSLDSVTCRFGKRAASYHFGNLRNYSCISRCVWKKSCFAMVDSSDFLINQTRIGRGQVPLESEVPYVAQGLTFVDAVSFRAGAPVLKSLVPERLAFPFPHQDILNVGIGMTLISQRLFESLWTKLRPKSRVLGLIGSRPLVHVDFGVSEP